MLERSDNMGKIIQLDDNLSNLIAAGEVVENMASVVKELVENSIDAESKNIKIDLLESGLNEIKVTDDGTGMSQEDMRMSIKRHATSKIRTSNDLYHISTLGFRGEAIPSIASVSHFEIISSLGESGYRLFYLKGDLKEEGSSIPRKGTSISVRYLFYNTPARLKHLKASNTELSYIIDYVNKMALSHPEISFILTNNRKTLFHSTGSNDHLRVLSNIYSLDIVKNMVMFENKNQYFKVSGYLTKPMFNRSSRNHITIIVNGRVIKNNKIINAVTEGFRTYLPIGKYPIVLLKIDLDPLLIDVNIHPQKLEVKFTEERMLLSLITKTINEKLGTLSLIPEMKEEVKAPQNYKYEKLNLKETAEENPNLVKEDFKNYIDDLVDKKIKQDILDSYKTEEEQLEIKKLPELEYIGQLLGTYLIFQNEEGMYIMDQHAAAERVRYELYYKKMSEPKIETYELLIPITLNLSNSEVFELKDKFNIFEPLGVKFEVNEVQSIDITQVPTWFIEGYEGIYTEEIVRYVLEGKDITIGQVKDSLAKNLSCKHSIKANKFINKNEVKKLLLDLDNCINPFTCPHGRPTIINFTVTDIEKMFKRIM
ncbi:MAG: DNA mismatch repair protein MutL [Candidatus Izimaplasma bacterium HR2]|nr:MAG: DNA mismatch repair protein MutL [Candidatus Izimaplasma bacterium HR2]